MWPFKKKVKPITSTCIHKYKDFPWYLEATYYTDTNRIDIYIKEPYVCVKCKDRKDVVLYNVSRLARNDKEAADTVNFFKEEYQDKLKPLPVVNDMIADMQMVDREYLDTLESILNPKNPLENL